jgi:hypothetical protein
MYGTDLSSLTNAPACAALMVKAGAALHGVTFTQHRCCCSFGQCGSRCASQQMVIVIAASRLVKRDEAECERSRSMKLGEMRLLTPVACCSISEEHEERFVSGIETLAKNTDCTLVPLLVLVTGTECFRGDMDDQQLAAYRRKVEKDVELNFVFIEHTVTQCIVMYELKNSMTCFIPCCVFLLIDA